MRTRFLIFVFLALPLNLHANEIVADANIELLPGGPVLTDYNLRVFQDPEATDETNIWFSLLGFFEKNGTTFVTLRFNNLNIDEASDWYLANFDDEFTSTNICNGEFELWGGATKDGKGLILGNEIIFAVYNAEHGALPVYLAVNTGSYELGPSFGLPRNIFGWVELRITPRNLIELIGSAMSYRATGITVGRDFLFGDINCDGSADLLDVSPFIKLLIGGEFMEAADFDGDGQITLLDVDPFVEALSGN